MILLALALQFPPVDPQVIKRLDDGEIVVELREGPGGIPEGTACGIVGAPMEKVWALMTDFDSYSRFYTGIPRSRTRQRTPGAAQVYLVVDFPWPLPDRWVTLDFKMDEAGRVFEWRRVGGTVRRYEGVARFAPWGGGRTVMRFDAVVDPGYAFLPGWLLAYFTAQSLPGVVSGPRDYFRRTSSAPSDRPGGEGADRSLGGADGRRHESQ